MPFRSEEVATRERVDRLTLERDALLAEERRLDAEIHVLRGGNAFIRTVRSWRVWGLVAVLAIVGAMFGWRVIELAAATCQ